MLSNQKLNNLLSLQVSDSSSEVLIYSEDLSPRLKYTLDFIFRQLGLMYKLTDSPDDFKSAEGQKINYSKQHFTEVINIFPSGFLSESGISVTIPSVSKENGFILFQDESPLGFDLFAAVFYMISRYEEWQPYKKDAHQRFELSQSLLFKNNVHLQPVTDQWVQKLKHELLSLYPGLKFSSRQFKQIATLDIDNLFAFRGKGFVRTGGAFAKDLIKGNIDNARRRLSVIQNKTKDPFDIYEDVSLFCEANSIPLICFFLMATGTAFDRSVAPESNLFSRVFGVLRNHGAVIGLHPSYYVERNNLLVSQKRKIENRISSEVLFSRQHYLRFDIRTTPNYLLSNGITHDFTMGFASGAGFRAGTSFPFYYYDFDKEDRTNLVLVPFCAMDGAYTVYGGINARDALKDLIALKDEVKKVNGYFVTVFHERTFDDKIAPGFGAVYKQLLISDHL